MADWPLGDAEADYARSAVRAVPAVDPLGGHRRTQARRTRGRMDPNAAPLRSAHGSKAKAPWPASRAPTTGSTISPTSTLDSIECGAGVLIERQRDSHDLATAGAWFTDDETRMDDQQHAISGLLALAALLEETQSAARSEPGVDPSTGARSGHDVTDLLQLTIFFVVLLDPLAARSRSRCSRRIDRRATRR